MTPTQQSKRDLYQRGLTHVEQFVQANRNTVSPVVVHETPDPVKFGTCAYYRSSEIFIQVSACAHIGTGGRAWSYPGYVTDRTPYGVLAHELGHHVDKAHGSNGGILCHELRARTGEEPITSYAPNTQEWFAEIFRLFVTNPDLLRLVRPKMHGELAERFTSVEKRAWDQVVTAERQQAVARTKIAQAQNAVRRRSVLVQPRLGGL